MTTLKKYQNKESIFSDVWNTDEYGILLYSYDISVEALLNAYANGVFPWPYDDESIPWFAPDERGILEFEKLHISKRLQRHFKKNEFEFRINTNFKKVIKNCATVTRKGQSGTWITDKLLEVYTELNKEGFAISFETYYNNELVGGMYGVLIDNYFAGESMFALKSNASKFALVNACDFFRRKGMEWIDIQTITPLLQSFGATEISKLRFMQKLKSL